MYDVLRERLESSLECREELDFIPKNKNVNELKDYARRNKLTGCSNQRKQKLIELVNSDRKEKAKNLLSRL